MTIILSALKHLKIITYSELPCRYQVGPAHSLAAHEH